MVDRQYAWEGMDTLCFKGWSLAAPAGFVGKYTANQQRPARR